MKSPLKLTAVDFALEVERSDRPVLVEFWAEWCGPCHAMGPVIAELSEDFKRIAKVGRLDVVEEPEVARRFEIRTIPALLFFRNGNVVDRLVGRTPKDLIAARLEALAAAARAEV